MLDKLLGSAYVDSRWRNIWKNLRKNILENSKLPIKVVPINFFLKHFPTGEPIGRLSLEDWHILSLMWLESLVGKIEKLKRCSRHHAANKFFSTSAGRFQQKQTFSLQFPKIKSSIFSIFPTWIFNFLKVLFLFVKYNFQKLISLVFRMKIYGK